MTIEADIRESILANKGLRVVKINNKAKLTNKALLPDDKSGCKSHLMLYVEAHHKVPIEVLIWSDSVSKISERLELPARTISKWRTKFPKNIN